MDAAPSSARSGEINSFPSAARRATYSFSSELCTHARVAFGPHRSAQPQCVDGSAVMRYEPKQKAAATANMLDLRLPVSTEIISS